MTRSEQGFSLNPMTRDEKTNITEKKALYRLEMRKEAPVIILTSFARSLAARNGDKFSCV